MKAGVIVFPGSNCDLDAYHLLRDLLKKPVRYIYFDSGSLGDCDLVVLPGGFTYGDYLRSGAIARFSPVMEAVADFAASGGLVLGICNGFQVLTEAGLLPGALYRNHNLQFRCGQVYLKVENSELPFTSRTRRGELLMMPIAHGDGSYYLPPGQLAEIEERSQVVFRYCDRDGRVNSTSNPNGSLDNIAGVCNRAGNVLGMMPHPERAGEKILGSEQGLVIFESVIDYFSTGGMSADG